MYDNTEYFVVVDSAWSCVEGKEIADKGIVATLLNDNFSTERHTGRHSSFVDRHNPVIRWKSRPRDRPRLSLWNHERGTGVTGLGTLGDRGRNWVFMERR